MRNTISTLVAIVGVAGVVGGISGNALAGAAALTGSGDHLYIDSSTPDFPEMEIWTYSSVVNNVSFDAGWSSSVLPAWRGSLSATGPTGMVGQQAGTTIMNFDGLPGDELAMGTFFNFGDLDGGSGNEAFSFRAFDSVGVLIEEAWLSGIVGVRYVNGSAPDVNNMPSWNFENGLYSFAGNNTVGNPNDVFALTNLTEISSLEFSRSSSTSNGFSLGAPVPTPGAMSLLSIGGVLASKRRR